MAKILCLDCCQPETEEYQKFQHWLLGINACCQLTANCWVVSTAETTKQIADRLLEYLGPEVRLFTADLEKGTGAWVNILESSEILKNILKE